MYFYSNGKFLITGEYLVMQGALALAMPLKFGQSINIADGGGKRIVWKSFVKGNLWFEAVYSLPDLAIISANDQEKAHYLSQLLVEAKSLNPKTLILRNGIEIVSMADFDINWGLGSSSTLISNIAYLFDINPFDLHFKVSKGSGFDIACARADSPLFYQLKNQRPIVQQVDFNPPFKEQLYFVYSGKKERSDKSIRKLTDRLTSREKESQYISEITQKIIAASTLDEFRLLMDEHEKIMSGVLCLPTVKDLLFSNLDESVKSLGAWGGDFVMMTWKDDKKSLLNYLHQKGFKTVFSFDEIAYNRNISEING